MKRPIAEREQIVSSFVKQEIGKDTAAQLLGCTKRTLESYVNGYIAFKTAGLVDHRKSNNCKLSSSQTDRIVSLKKLSNGDQHAIFGITSILQSMSERYGRFLLPIILHE